MLSNVQVALFQWSNPRKVVLSLNLLLLALTLAGCNIVAACPAGGSGGGCSGG